MIMAIFRFVGFMLMTAGLCLFGWPFPLFTLNDPYLSWYTENVLMVDSRPGGASAALPFLWLITAPLGVAVGSIGIAVFALSKPSDVSSHDA